MSSGYAELSRQLSSLGQQAARVVTQALSQLLGHEVRLSGRALPGHSVSVGPNAKLPFDLPALPGAALVELDATLVARIVNRMAGSQEALSGATGLTPIETSVLELMTLVSLDALSRLDPVERTLSPRLTRVLTSPTTPLCVALELAFGEESGRGLLWLPSAAVRALRGRAELPRSIARARVDCSLRQGCASLSTAELAELEHGDVLLLDPDPTPVLTLPGGTRLKGQLVENSFRVEEVT